MTLCQHDDCDREGIAAWNGCVFCDEHVRERLRTTADSKLLARIDVLEAAANEVLRVYMPQFNDSRAVDDCLVLLAAAVAGVATLVEAPKVGSPLSDGTEP